ncbi:MAG: CBS domain-containing protein [Spirochaetes bacterium]|nr:CBS domain-containing protein [Spirochaetota bacterium]
MADETPLVVVGHKNPDTDSVCSAIAYARFKESTGVAATPFRAGNLNTQTRFVLDRFDCPSPELLTDLYPKLTDIMIPEEQLLLLTPDDPLSAAARIILDNDFSFLPIVDRNNVCVGKVTALRVARLVDELPLHAAGASVTEAVGAAMAAPIRHYLESAEPTFDPLDLVRDVEQQINRYNAGGFVVQDDDGRIAGVITRVNFLTKARFTVALVDHNEFSQAVDGIDEADVVEVIDHHHTDHLHQPGARVDLHHHCRHVPARRHRPGRANCGAPALRNSLRHGHSQIANHDLRRCRARRVVGAAVGLRDRCLRRGNVPGRKRGGGPLGSTDCGTGSEALSGGGLPLCGQPDRDGRLQGLRRATG